MEGHVNLQEEFGLCGNCLQVSCNHKITNKERALMPGFLEKTELRHFYFLPVSET